MNITETRKQFSSQSSEAMMWGILSGSKLQIKRPSELIEWCAFRLWLLSAHAMLISVIGYKLITKNLFHTTFFTPRAGLHHCYCRRLEVTIISWSLDHDYVNSRETLPRSRDNRNRGLFSMSQVRVTLRPQSRPLIAAASGGKHRHCTGSTLIIIL